MQPIVEAKHLSKQFGKITSVHDLSFSILPGDVYGFLGQNGAGKSTTMRMILGLIFPTSGQVFINGEEMKNSKRHLLQNIGAIIEKPDMYGYLSGWDNLRIFARLSLQRITDSRLYDVLEIVGLRGREKDIVNTYSQGMKQRLGIAIALVHNPQLLVLDEPTNGLDPQGITEIRHLIARLRNELNKTVLISSHLLYEVEQVATRMLIIHKGQKVVEGTVNELLNPDDTLFEIQWTNIPSGLQENINNSIWQRHIVNLAADRVEFKMNPAQMPELNRWLVHSGANIIAIKAKHSLESYFLSLTNDTLTKN